jgi:capsular exopolysaccharide synthesis family protein
MSQIFDGLQRSEAQLSRTNVSAPLRAIELLQLVERRESSRWESEVLSETPAEGKTAECEIPFDPLGAPTVTAAPEASAEIEASPKDELLDSFGQFRSLQVSLAATNRLVSLADSGSPAAEAFRLLGVRLRHLRRDRSLKQVLITSTIPEEGKSMVAANLACTLAQGTRQRVLLLEGDLRRPSLSQMFGLGRNPGLCECLLGEGSLPASIYHLEGPDLWILPSGSAPSNALELLQSGRLSALMNQLNVWFDWVIIDSPPVLPLADTSVWMRLADGILLVTRQGTTEKRQLQRGLEAIEPKKLIGALMNGSRNPANSSYYYSLATPSRPNDTSAN